MKQGVYEVGTFGTVSISTLHPSSATTVCNQHEVKSGRAFATVTVFDKLPCTGGGIRDVYILNEVYLTWRTHLDVPAKRIDLVSLDAIRHHMYAAKSRFKKWVPPKQPKPPKVLSNVEQMTLGRIPVHEGCTVIERVQASQTHRASILSDPTRNNDVQSPQHSTSVTAPTCSLASNVSEGRRPVVESLHSNEQHSTQLLLNLSGRVSVSATQDPLLNTQSASASGPGINLDIHLYPRGMVHNDVQVNNPILLATPAASSSTTQTTSRVPTTQTTSRVTPTTDTQSITRMAHSSAKEVNGDQRRRQPAVITRDIGLNTCTAS
ncbi:hypothetical protein SARC_03444 [Sphaeroforma arctica JP610]|uniref:Uncharacterized protein n=1 Tax=Sphaeroforma arctica JP610 TaxID=667725 RepID=A0A0L0G5V9_9EUKA|nr:hypothetical protein SARC_03444 [Sphaeroforma arctica JP610]KNC84339.1 hypothetical protein SARC_03444 [Sphaeroforma arctica JP610]|eukprot:XP_014158241.1 hypothetical protein SARC_03444 [Sphaeroforma arctica JP610]